MATPGVAALARSMDSIRDAKAAAAGYVIAFPQDVRALGGEVIDSLSLCAQRDVPALLPSAPVAAKLDFPYDSGRALTELNGAIVRISGVVDEVSGMADGLDVVSADVERRLREAVNAGYDLELKILGYEETAPDSWHTVAAEAGVIAGEVGSGVGGILGEGVGAALGKTLGGLFSNLWFYLGLVVAALVFFYAGGPRLLAGLVRA